MIDTTLAQKLCAEIREIAAAGPPGLEIRVERHLENALDGWDLASRLELLEDLARRLEPPSGSQRVLPQPVSGNRGSPPGPNVAETATQSAGNRGCEPAPVPEDIHRLISRFLGRSQDNAAISPGELAEKFALSLDTLFDSLNQIVSVINVTLLGYAPELETIRMVIGSHLKGEGGDICTREYLERIQRAFLVAHTSFQLSAATLLDEVLAELDPEALSRARSTGLKFGPLRKADLFEQYEQKHARCKRWLDSGEFKERLLREFEKQCQRQLNGTIR